MTTPKKVIAIQIMQKHATKMTLRGSMDKVIAALKATGQNIKEWFTNLRKSFAQKRREWAVDPSIRPQVQRFNRELTAARKVAPVAQAQAARNQDAQVQKDFSKFVNTAAHTPHIPTVSVSDPSVDITEDAKSSWLAELNQLSPITPADDKLMNTVNTFTPTQNKELAGNLKIDRLAKLILAARSE